MVFEACDHSWTPPLPVSPDTAVPVTVEPGATDSVIVAVTAVASGTGIAKVAMRVEMIFVIVEAGGAGNAVVGVDVVGADASRPEAVVVVAGAADGDDLGGGAEGSTSCRTGVVIAAGGDGTGARELVVERGALGAAGGRAGATAALGRTSAGESSASVRFEPSNRS